MVHDQRGQLTGKTLGQNTDRYDRAHMAGWRIELSSIARKRERHAAMENPIKHITIHFHECECGSSMVYSVETSEARKTLARSVLVFMS